MKLQILQLDPTDDQVSIRDKLTRVKADRVLLVWPRRGQPISDRLSLVLVQRTARDLGIQLGLLSHDPQVSDAARHINLPQFGSVEEASRQSWPEPAGVAYPARPNAATKNARLKEAPAESERALGRSSSQPIWLRALLFGAAVLALLALLAALIPAATVVIDPATEARDWHSTVWVGLEGESANPPGPAISGILRTTTVSGSVRAATTGSSRVPDQAATGQLLFTNLTQEAVTLVVGTSVRATDVEGVRFVTTEPAELAPEQDAVVTVAAQAAAAGPQGNIPAGAIDAVDGPVGLQVQVTNPQPFVGGSERVQPIVAQRDVDRLRLEVEQSLLDQAAEQLEASLPPGQSLIGASLQVDEIIELEYDAQVGQPAASLGLTMSAQTSAVAYSLEDLRLHVEQLIPDQASDNWRPIPGSLTILDREGLVRGDQIGIGVSAEWQAYQPVEVSRIRAWLVAKPSEQDLAELPVVQGAELLEAHIQPTWWPRYPCLGHRIAVRYPWQAH